MQLGNNNTYTDVDAVVIQIYIEPTILLQFMKLCSACLLGVKCRHDGKNKPSKNVIELAKREFLIPVCPGQLGGLPTPREQAERRGERVLTRSGRDVTKNFRRGAIEVLKLAKLFDIREAIFTQRSPSCGCGQVYDGTFSGRTVKGEGVTTALLKRNGIKVVSEEDLK